MRRAFVPTEHARRLKMLDYCHQGSRSPLAFFLELEDLMDFAGIPITSGPLFPRFIGRLTAPFRAYLDVFLRMGHSTEDVDSLVQRAQAYYYKRQRMIELAIALEEVTPPQVEDEFSVENAMEEAANAAYTSALPQQVFQCTEPSIANGVAQAIVDCSSSDCDISHGTLGGDESEKTCLEKPSVAEPIQLSSSCNDAQESANEDHQAIVVQSPLNFMEPLDSTNGEPLQNSSQFEDRFSTECLQPASRDVASPVIMVFPRQTSRVLLQILWDFMDQLKMTLCKISARMEVKCLLKTTVHHLVTLHHIRKILMGT